MKRNAIVGPTAAINATLAGVICGALDNANVDKIYGMFNGIAGLLDGNIKELNEIFETEENFKLLEYTPAAALASCRLKLPDSNETNALIRKNIQNLSPLTVQRKVCLFDGLVYEKTYALCKIYF